MFNEAITALKQHERERDSADDSKTMVQAEGDGIQKTPRKREKVALKRERLSEKVERDNSKKAA